MTVESGDTQVHDFWLFLLTEEDSLVDVVLELIAVTRWFDLGLMLGLKPATLEKIKINNREKVDDCKRDMLLDWLRKVDNVPQKGQPSWRTLVVALRGPLAHYPDIADNIARKHRK